MSLPSLPATLSPAPSGRDGVADAIYRCVAGLDTADLALFQSALTRDAVFELNGSTMMGREAIVSDCYDRISKLDTTHFITNLRVNILDGGSKAEATCAALSQHFGTGKGMEPAAARLLAGGLYWMELVLDDADRLWKMKSWKFKSTWAEGDWTVMSGQ